MPPASFGFFVFSIFSFVSRLMHLDHLIVYDYVWKIYYRGVKVITINSYWQKPLTVTALAVIKFY
jgi:hypothetical protein